MSDVRVAFYGDDFTGSVDALLQFVRAGWRGRLFTTVPDEDTLRAAAEHNDVIGIAGITRSLAPERLSAELTPALSALARLHPHVIQYKVCSTADSSPTVGSIGLAVEIGLSLCGDRSVPILFAQPDFGRYTVFGHHFAAEEGVIHRLDRQPTMAHHPSTPMGESDLVVHLSRQTTVPLRNIPVTQYTDAGALTRDLSGPHAGIVLDALDDYHLRLIGHAILQLPTPVFAIGSGGLSTALGSAWRGGATAVPLRTHEAGPVLAVSGSRSDRTARQIRAAVAAGWFVEPLSEDPAQPQRVRSALHEGRSVILPSTDAEFDGDALPRISRAAVAVIDEALHHTACRRVIVCGGDTSSRVVRLLGVEALSIAANPYGNVVVCRAHARDPFLDGTHLLLKGGQVGDDDLFETVRAHRG